MSTRNAFEDPDKRSAILEQAIAVFAKAGYRGTDVQVIADRANVGKGTVYRYFKSKEDLFWAATYEVFSRMERSVFEAIEKVEGARAKFRAAATAYAHFFDSNPNYLELTVQDRAEFHGSGPESHRQAHQRMIGRMAEILQQGIDAGEIRPVDPQQTTIGLGSLLYGAAILGCHLQSVDMQRMTEHAVEIFLRGIETEHPARAEGKHQCRCGHKCGGHKGVERHSCCSANKTE
jgi:AcrR family transcriptional regulator